MIVPKIFLKHQKMVTIRNKTLLINNVQHVVVFRIVGMGFSMELKSSLENKKLGVANPTE